MAKLNSGQKTIIKQAKANIEKAAYALQTIQDVCDSENAAILEEIGVSLGFAINEIDENLL